MPNHVTTEVTFSNTSEEERDRILAIVCGGDGKVDFEVLLPTPINVWQGDVGTRHTKAFGESGLDWSARNWGTKWNAYGARSVTVDGETVTVLFETAWEPPRPWLLAIYNTMKRPFEYLTLSEGWERAQRGVFGPYEWFTTRKGEPWREDEADEASHRRIHKLRWGVEEFPRDDDEDASGVPSGSLEPISENAAGT